MERTFTRFLFLYVPLIFYAITLMRERIMYKHMTNMFTNFEQTKYFNEKMT